MTSILKKAEFSTSKVRGAIFRKTILLQVHMMKTQTSSLFSFIPICARSIPVSEESFIMKRLMKGNVIPCTCILRGIFKR